MTAPTLRQCLIYALPALIIGAVLRFSYMAAIPEAFVNADTSSYLHTGYEFWHHGALTTLEKRRWWYPIWVAAMSPLPGSLVQTVAAVQHLVGLGTLICAAWIVGNLTRFWRFWIPPVTLLIAIWPQMLYYEHVFLAESFFLAAFMLTVALSMPVSRLKEPDRLFYFLLSLTFAVGLRPSGRALWLGALVLLVMVARHRETWKWKNIIAALFCTATALTAGSSKDGSRLLLSSVIPLLDTKAASYAEYRQALEPIVLETRQYGTDYYWFQAKYKKRLDSDDDPLIGEAWRHLTKDNAKFKKVCLALAVETIVHHPILFTRFTLMKFFSASAKSDIPIQYLKSSSQFDPESYWAKQIAQNGARWGKMGDKLFWIYGGLDQEGWDKMAAERQTRTLWFSKYVYSFEFGLPWAIEHEITKDGAPELRISWLGWLAIAGLALCFLPRLFVPSMMLWLPFLVYVGLIFGVGDRLERFVQPIQWIWICLCAIPLDLICVALTGGMRRKALAPKG